MANYLPNKVIVSFNELDFFKPITGIEISSNSFILHCFLDNKDTIEVIDEIVNDEEVYDVIIDNKEGFIFSGKFIFDKYKIYFDLDYVSKIDFYFIREN